MSSSTLLYSIARNLFRFGGPVLIIIGSIGSILNLMVFTKKALRKNPCTICFVAVNLINFVYFYLGLLFTVLASGYDIDPSSTNISFCRFRFYIALILTNWESSFLILASIDRTFITSPNAGTRKLSTRRLIYISTIGIAVFWILFHVHALIFTEILQFGPDYYVCYFQLGMYTTLMTYNALITNGTLPLLLMMLFGLWTVKNVRQVGRPTCPAGKKNTGSTVVGRQHTVQSKDRQLIRMLFMNIILFIICRSPVTIILMYQQITKYENKSADQQIIEQLIIQITYFVFFIENSVGCYTNILVSKTFRTELKRIFSNAHLV